MCSRVHCLNSTRAQLQGTKSGEETANVEQEEDNPVSDAELQNLRDLLKQRDDEISILLKMLKQEKRRAANAEATLKQSGIEYTKPSSPILGRTSPLQLEPGTAPLGVPSPVHAGSEGHQEKVRRETLSQTGSLEREDEEQKRLSGVPQDRGHNYISNTQSRESAEWKAAMKAGVFIEWISSCTCMLSFGHIPSSARTDTSCIRMVKPLCAALSMW